MFARPLMTWRLGAGASTSFGVVIPRATYCRDVLMRQLCCLCEWEGTWTRVTWSGKSAKDQKYGSKNTAEITAMTDVNIPQLHSSSASDSRRVGRRATFHGVIVL